MKINRANIVMRSTDQILTIGLLCMDLHTLLIFEVVCSGTQCWFSSWHMKIYLDLMSVPLGSVEHNTLFLFLFLLPCPFHPLPLRPHTGDST